MTTRLLENFKSALQLQQQKQDEEFENLMNTPLSERIAKGETMANIKVEFEFHSGMPSRYCRSLKPGFKYISRAILYCEDNISKFREGGSVTLSNGPHKFTMEIIEDSIKNFILSPNAFEVSNCFIDTTNYPENNWEVNVVNSNISQKLLSATASYLSTNDERTSTIEHLLEGNLENHYSERESVSLLNESQDTAISSALGCKHFHLIQGPPGTGKTLTIAHLSKQLLKEGQKIFITGPTHTAINNCLAAISNVVDQQSHIVKIGEKHQSLEINNLKNIIQTPRLPLDKYRGNAQYSQQGITIGATPYSLCYPASKRLNNWTFDVAIIDEASQLSIPLAIAVMSRCKKVIFVGDHKQLDPIIPSATGNPLFESSIFKKLVDLYPSKVSLLNISYRLNENLVRIPNELFYDNKLTTANHELAQYTDYSCSKHPEVLNHSDPKILFLHHEFDAKGRSPYEANIIAGIVADLIKNGVQLKDIAIISPYRAQVREIKKALNSQITEDTTALFVDTVDRMQGQEMDYVIYSMSNSHPLESKRRLEFFYSPNRLNVAITRARQKCIVIANEKVFDIIDHELTDLPNYIHLKPSLDVFKRYYELSTKIEDIQQHDEW